MRKLMILSAAVFVALSGTAAQTVVVRSAENGRTWQTVYDPSQPLSWPWPAAATSAKVVFSNETTGAVCESAEVVRGDGALYGQLSSGVPASWTEGQEALVSATLTISGTGGARETHVARLAYLPASFSVFRTGTRAWTRASGGRIGAYDAAWKEETATAETATLAVTPPAAAAFETDLDGTSGYFPVSATTMLGGGGFGDVCLSLGFDSTADAWLATVGIYGSGLLLFVR